MLWTFLLNLKHNAIKCQIQNTGKTPVKNEYGKFLQIKKYIVPYFFRV